VSKIEHVRRAAIRDFILAVRSEEERLKRAHAPCCGHVPSPSLSLRCVSLVYVLLSYAVGELLPTGVPDVGMDGAHDGAAKRRCVCTKLAMIFCEA
jgi:hypothetical protein